MASKKAIGVISKLLEQTTTKPIPEDSLDVWVMVLAPLSDELAIAATLQVARTERRSFAVAPGAIYQTALELVKAHALSPGGAWGALGEALDKVANREGWDLFDALPDEVKRAAKQAGLPGLIDGRHLVADRARFLEFYCFINNQAATAQLALPYSEKPGISLSNGEDPRKRALRRGSSRLSDLRAVVNRAGAMTK